ncbi:MAG: lysophospholipase [Azoarcus sp.]|jgi:non-heme chloroperoxidase|nr:lysophospholipase [Azoarcus sp.]
MNTIASPDALEIISHPPTAPAVHPVPLLFVHGAFVGAWCWEENFLPWFAGQGWAVHALSLSGHGRSRRHDELDNCSINDYVADLAQTIAAFPAPPVLIGHSMGGMVVQKYLEQAAVPAAVLMASVPPQGLLGSAFGMLFSVPHLLVDLNRMMGGGEPGIDSLREALFHQPIPTEKLRHYKSMSQPESARALWDMTLFNLPRPACAHKAPMLVLGAGQDRLISPAQVFMTADAWGCKPEIFEDMGHAMMLERDWEKVARRISDWLTALTL